MSKGFDPRGTTSATSVLFEAIRAQVIELHTALPGVIVAFNPADQSATVQLAIKREILNDTQSMTVLDDVPVMVQGGGGFSVTFPIAAGDPCLVVFMERGIDNWYLDGGTQPPATRRHHHLSDAICIPGLRPAPSALPAYDAANLVLRTNDGRTQLVITPAGQFALTNGTEELLKIVDDLASEVAALRTVVTGGSSAGVYQHNRIAQINAIRARLATLLR